MAHIRETMLSASSQVCDSALSDLSQDKVPFHGEEWAPQRITCGGNRFQILSWIAVQSSCFLSAGGKSGQIPGPPETKAFSISLSGPLRGPEPCHHKCPRVITHTWK